MMHALLHKARSARVAVTALYKAASCRKWDNIVHGFFFVLKRYFVIKIFLVEMVHFCFKDFFVMKRFFLIFLRSKYNLYQVEGYRHSFYTR